MKNKQELIAQIVALLNEVIEAEEKESKPVPEAAAPIEYAQNEQVRFIKECVKEVCGLSEHTLRQLIAQDKIPYIRTGQGKRGKILINKSALLNYLNTAA